MNKIKQLDMLLCKAKVKWNGNHYSSGQWVYGYVFINNLSGEVYMIDVEEDEFGNIPFQKVEIDEETICRFTGQKDDNGVNIYENDILLVTFPLYNSKVGTDKIKVEWDEEKSAFQPFYYQKSESEWWESNKIFTSKVIVSERDEEIRNV